MSPKTIKYFPGLNALRFFAAFLVVLHHGATIRDKYKLELHFNHLGIFNNGEKAVTFFFVLSGFLITYLLMQERYITKNISVKNFYKKRILRIWPLYFLLVIIGAIIFPFLVDLLKIDYQMPYSLSETWYYFVFFLPGLVTYFYGPHLLQPLWSIGVEEVFYIIWAPLVKLFKNKILFLLCSVLLLFLSIKFIGILWIKNDLLNYFMEIYRIEAMAIGGLGAYLIFYKGKQLNNYLLFNKTFQFIIILGIISFLFLNHKISHLQSNAILKVITEQLINFTFLYIIILAAFIDKKIFLFKSSILSYLGTISYGIYMYHMLVIFMIVHLFENQLSKLPEMISFILFYIIVTGLTILVSILSKKYFEDFFMRFRPKKEKLQQSS